MPNSFRIKTEIGINKVLPIKLDQQFDTLEILSLAVFPNDIYTRSCADFGVLCGRVFANRGFGITNARVSVFIPLDELDENNAIISTLYPYKRTEDFNEDGYKYNLLPYTQSHSGHVPVGTFPERLDALTNQSVIEVYDKYYKFTAKTNESGDFMIFGLPIGQHNIFMQVDLSDIGEFSLTPQDLVRMGRATETQIDGVKFKFSENYSELPQIVTIEKTIQVAPFYGEKDICEHYIVRTDFDLTSEAGVEFKPTSVFMGSIISHNNRKKLKKRCKVPAKAGWLCELITGPGQIEAIRQTIFKDSNGNPILEEFTLENSGKVIDENGTWVLEVPMNLDFVYTNEDGKKVLSDNPKLGVPTKGKYRFKVKWNQSPKVGEENKRGYFLVPNVKEWGWEDSDSENPPGSTPTSTNWNITSPTKFIPDLTFKYDPDVPPATGPRVVLISNALSPYFAAAFLSSVNVETFKILVMDADGNFIENPDYINYIPVGELNLNDVMIEFVAIDPNSESYFTYRVLDEAQFKQECSYTFSVNWADYGTTEMINEAINCEDRFYKMSYNKVYTVSQLIDRFAWQTFPQKAIEIKHITENKCEGDYNPFPANDVYYRYDIMFIILSFVMNFIVMPILICVIVIYHVLAWLYDIFTKLYPVLCSIREFLNKLKCALHSFSIGRWRPFGWVSCDPDFTCAPMEPNPFKNLRLGVFLYTDDGCERCKCNIQENNFPPGAIAIELQDYNTSFGNSSILPDFTTTETYQIPNLINFTAEGVEEPTDGGYYSFMPQIFAGGSGNIYQFHPDVLEIDELVDINPERGPSKFLLPVATDTLYNSNLTQFSPNLTLGERLNLFNTKIKYFDKEPSLSGNFSPGTIGWSQIKVTWFPELNFTPDLNNTDLSIFYNYTARYNNENVWLIPGDYTYLLGQTIYVSNNPYSIQNITSSPYLTVEVTAVNYVDGPPGIPLAGFTILEFTDTTSEQIVIPPVSISSSPASPPQPGVGFNCLGRVVDDPITNEPIWAINNYCYGGSSSSDNQLYTLLNCSIYVSNNPAPGGSSVYNMINPLKYYTENNPDVDLIMNVDTEATIIAMESIAADLIKITLMLPTGEIIKPRSVYNVPPEAPGATRLQLFRYKKSTGNLFQWSTIQPPPIYDTYHLDNVLVLLIEDDSIKTGDLFTFQDPNLSEDPNVGQPTGQINETTGGNNFVTVSYADPYLDFVNLGFSAGQAAGVQGYSVGPGNLTTEYVTPIIERTPWNSPFKRDLEYFQAISVIPFSAMTENRAPLMGTGTGAYGHNRFSLPWRFLDSSYGKSVAKTVFNQPLTYGCTYGTQTANYINNGAEKYTFALKIGEGTVDYGTSVLNPIPLIQNNEKGYYLYNDATTTSSTPYTSIPFTNDFRVYRYANGGLLNNTMFDTLVNGNCVIQYSPYTRAELLATPFSCSVADENQLIGGTTDIWSTIDTSKYKIVFMQRGVDPHSRKIKVRYDLSRLYGWGTYGANNDQYVIEGEYRMNIPIQGRNLQPDQRDMAGLELPSHCKFSNNGQQIDGQRLFYKSYLYSDTDSYSGNWTTNLHTYYSCFDNFAVDAQTGSNDDDPNWGNYLTPYYFLDTSFGFVSNGGQNLFGQTFELQNDSYTITDQGTVATWGGLDLNGETITTPCQVQAYCPDNIQLGSYAAGWTRNLFADIPPLKAVDNYIAGNTSGYWGGEYLEGASAMVAENEGDLITRAGFIGGKQYYFQLVLNNNTTWLSTPSEPSNCNACDIVNPDLFNVAGSCIDPRYVCRGGLEYFSPTYRTIVPRPNDPVYSAWADPNHTINMSSNVFIVFRSDRLPTSTTVVQHNANGLLMHQNNSFAVFVITDEGESTQEGGYELPDQAQGAEIDFNELPSENQAIIDSLVNCENAVNLNSYDVDADGNPYIKANDPFSIKEGETYFVRQMGCYNFVSVPFKSLAGVPDRFLGGGGDIASAVEWTRRTVLNFSLCFEIYSHTFSNNWINGTLYHFPFQLNTVFNSKNEPIRDYCRHVIYFHEPNQTFYYRSSPYNGTDFIGKENPGRTVNNYGNDKQLMYPTTLLDMGPKTNYLQELVFSDEYDGYIISKIPTTTFQNVNDLLNIFVLSRLVNTNFLQQLIPSNSGGNNEGADDPSVTGFFKNTRWANGDAFFRNLLPSIVDADYAQMLSINSEFGVKEYGPEVYTNNDIWFLNDNNGNSVFGVTLKSDNQERDYISPRRTIWNDNSAVPAPPGDFTVIPTESQKIPDYQWVIRFQYDNTANDPLQYPSIFGMQSNDFWTNAPSPQANDPGTPGGSTIFTSGFFYSKYQKLDRFDDFSEYFKTDIVNISKYYKAHIINYEAVVDSAGNIIYDSLGNVSAYTETANAPLPQNRRYAYTFGAPFHFYFGLIQGASAMDRFRTKYVDTNITYE